MCENFVLNSGQTPLKMQTIFIVVTCVMGGLAGKKGILVLAIIEKCKP